MHISRISTVNSFFEKSKTNPNNFNGGVEYSNKLLNFVYEGLVGPNENLSPILHLFDKLRKKLPKETSVVIKNTELKNRNYIVSGDLVSSNDKTRHFELPLSRLDVTPRKTFLTSWRFGLTSLFEKINLNIDFTKTLLNTTAKENRKFFYTSLIKEADNFKRQTTILANPVTTGKQTAPAVKKSENVGDKMAEVIKKQFRKDN